MKDYHFYIRRYSSTVEVKPNREDEQELLRLTATIPFDEALELKAITDPFFVTRTKAASKKRRKSSG